MAIRAAAGKESNTLIDNDTNHTVLIKITIVIIIMLIIVLKFSLQKEQQTILELVVNVVIVVVVMWEVENGPVNDQYSERGNDQSSKSSGRGHDHHWRYLKIQSLFIE